MRQFLRALPPAQAHLIRLRPKHLADADAELVCLDRRSNENVQVIDVHPSGEITERLPARNSHAHLREGTGKLSGQLVIPFLDHTLQRLIEPRARLDADDQEVDGIGKGSLDGSFPLCDPSTQPSVGHYPAESSQYERQANPVLNWPTPGKSQDDRKGGHGERESEAETEKRQRAQ